MVMDRACINFLQVAQEEIKYTHLISVQRSHGVFLLGID
jgi:hypothetical protein